MVNSIGGINTKNKLRQPILKAENSVEDLFPDYLERSVIRL